MRENRVKNTIMGCGGRKFPSLAENSAQKRMWTIFSDIYIPDGRNSLNQVLGLVTSQAKKKSFSLVKLN